MKFDSSNTETFTVDGTELWTYHTVFRIAGLIAIFGVLIQWGIQRTEVKTSGE